MGETAADLIADKKLRREVVDEALARTQRRAPHRWGSFAATSVSIVGMMWILSRFGIQPSSLTFMPIAIAGVACGLAGGLVVLVQLRASRKRFQRELWKVMAEHGLPICVHCGYSLAGTTEPRCPECGLKAK